MENKKLMDVVDIANLEAKNMSKLIKKPTFSSYSLSKELLETENELTVLEKKINLGNDLLVKVNDPVLISKLKKQKEEFEVQKNNLSILIEKLKLITDSIKDFTLFFIFIRRFYTLAIQKENFENTGKNISLKLITNLKSEEENLYNEYIDGNCFSKVHLALSFKPYESHFKEYAKNFFENIQHSSDPYVNSLLILKAIFYECMYFHTDNFNLTDIKFFLSKNIPINIFLPETNHELVALRCFFFYELLFEFLKLKPIKNNFEHLKKAVVQELNIVNYKANTKVCLLLGLNDLQQTLHKIDKKHNEFLERKVMEDKETDVNHALNFYKRLEYEIQTINKKNKILINNKYKKLEKMQRLLTIIVNESYLPKFLEVFNTKIGNDFFLNTIGKPDVIETNKEALNHLFHAICREEFYTPLNQRVSLFINEQAESFSKEDPSILDNIEFEDLIEFSFYYLFTLIYTDFNASLTGFNNKLLYNEMVTFNVFINCKLQSLEVLEKTKNTRIKKFIEKTFKNITEYNQHKQNLLEEIKLNLETIQDIKRILSDTKTLETSLFPKLETSLILMPENTFLIDSLKSLEKKQKICELEYQKIEKHKFINKSKSEKSKINEAQYRESSEIDYNKSIDSFSEVLSCLSENLFESLKYIKKSSRDVRQVRQKISSAMGQISASIQKLLSSLSDWKNTDEMEDLAKVSLPKLLEIVEKLIIKNDLMDKEDYKKKLTELQKLHVRSCSLIEDLINQVNPIINEYRKYNNEANKILDKSSTSLVEDHSSSVLFSESTTKKVKPQINGNLSNDYNRLKEQSSWLEKLIRLIKCDSDDRVLKLFAISAEDYQKSYELLNDKLNSFKKIPNKTLNFSKQTFSATKGNFCDNDKKIDLTHSIRIEDATKDISIRKLNNEQIETTAVTIINDNDQQVFNQALVNNQELLIAEKKSQDENIIFESSIEKLSNNSDLISVTLIQDYETWDFEFGKWKNEKNIKMYELFHIIESCSKTVLTSSDKAFLKCLSLYQKELSDKNDELREKKNQITICFKDSNQARIVTSYLAQYQKWFDEIFQRIILCKTLILQNENDPVVQESPRLPSSSADNRAEFKNLLTFYLSATNKYNKFRNDLISEENKLINLNRKFIKHVLMLGSDGMSNQDNVLSDFSKQLDRVNQLKLAIEQEFETKQKIKKKLTLFSSPETVKFYLSRIDPYDADLENAENYLLPIEAITPTNYIPTSSQECNTCPRPITFCQMPFFSTVYPVNEIQTNNQIFYSM